MTFSTKPLTAGTWPDLEAVFNARGCSVARGCWCMFYRKTGSVDWSEPGYAKKNRQSLKSLAGRGQQVGLVGYQDGVPCGWISFGPRGDFARLANSTIMKPVDEKPVWSVICFVVPSEFRKQGVARRKPTRPVVRLKVV